MVTLDAPEEWGYCRNNDPKNSHPSLDWLNFCAYGEEPNSPVVQAIALEENIARGRDLLEKELGKSGFEALLKSDNAGCSRAM